MSLKGSQQALCVIIQYQYPPGLVIAKDFHGKANNRLMGNNDFPVFHIQVYWRDIDIPGRRQFQCLFNVVATGFVLQFIAWHHYGLSIPHIDSCQLPTIEADHAQMAEIDIA